jgi:hypothetical protein
LFSGRIRIIVFVPFLDKCVKVRSVQGVEEAASEGRD